ncbi:MAG: ATP-binding protein [Deltaproteobacteria bacterium]
MFFKSLRWRLVSIFFLLVISIMIVVGTYLLFAVEKTYKDEFISQMKQSVEAFSEKDIEKNISDDSPNYGYELFKTFKNIFVINNINRKGYLLDSFGKMVYASDPTDLKEQSIAKTPNIISAISGKIGDKITDGDEQLDYAKPIIIDGNVKYILYIKYNKDGLKNILNRLKSIIFYAMFSALAISILLGYLLAQAITGPISDLIKRTEKIASGDFEYIKEDSSGDELGKLIDSFNYMSIELKDTLGEISNEKSKIVTILLHMADGVIAFDVEGNIIHANPAAQNMLDINPDREDFSSIFSRLGVNTSKEEIIKLENQKNIENSIIYKNKDYRLVFASFKGEDAKTNGIITVIHDITEQQKLDNMRREFVANVSHELKTPLTSIKTYTETLIDGAIEDKATAIDFLNVINSESSRMSRIVSDLLQLSRLDYKETRLNKVEFDLGEMAIDVVEKIKIETDKKNQVMKCEVKEGIPKVYADRDGIIQVVVNIISNSIKYTPEKGKISVAVGSDDGCPYIKVKDNGIGIPAKDVPRIFERFYRVDKARSREMGGTGLGLSIAKEIIEANGGSISIESALGKGTDVTISLPVKDCMDSSANNGQFEASMVFQNADVK